MRSNAIISGELVIAVDFDGTITTNPNVGDVITLRENCVEAITELYNAGAILILWTCRTGDSYVECIRFLNEVGICHMFSTYNENIKEVQEKYEIDARKVGADLYIDDKSFGVKLDNLWNDVLEYVFGIKEEVEYE